jgi:hypothetical protein
MSFFATSANKHGRASTTTKQHNNIDNGQKGRRQQRHYVTITHITTLAPRMSNPVYFRDIFNQFQTLVSWAKTTHQSTTIFPRFCIVARQNSVYNRQSAPPTSSITYLVGC